MIDHVWSVLCSKAIIDRRSNSISLIDAIEAVAVELRPNAPDTITVPVPSSLVSLWTRSDPDAPAFGQSRVRLINPHGKEMRGLFSRELEIDLSTHLRFRTVYDIGGFAVNTEGRFIFEVDLKKKDRWRTVARIPLDVTLTRAIEDSSENTEDS